MNEFEAYQLYVGLKTHFTNSRYDYFSNFPRRITAKTYNKRHDHWCFRKLARHPDLVGLLVSNLIIDTNIWSEYLLKNEAEMNLVEYNRRRQSLFYTFQEDIKQLNSDFDSNIKTIDGSIPPLFCLLIRGIICLESVVIITDITNALGYWDKQLKGDLLWETTRLKLKYRSFMEYEKKKYQNEMVRTFNDGYR